MPVVLNMYRVGRRIPDSAIYVGRPSLFGNHFTHLEAKKGQQNMTYVATREESVKRYKSWVLHSDDARAVLIREALPSLRGRDLVCWCAPHKCHADVLLELANSPVPIIGGNRRKTKRA